MPKQTLTMGKPTPRGHYAVSDGSRIYASGTASRSVRPGLWFVWLKGPDRLVDGRWRQTGEVLLERGGIRYFRSPEEALRAVREAREAGQANAR